jgi:hypothetical protein
LPAHTRPPGQLGHDRLAQVGPGWIQQWAHFGLVLLIYPTNTKRRRQRSWQILYFFLDLTNFTHNSETAIYEGEGRILINRPFSCLKNNINVIKDFVFFYILYVQTICCQLLTEQQVAPCQQTYFSCTYIHCCNSPVHTFMR